MAVFVLMKNSWPKLIMREDLVLFNGFTQKDFLGMKKSVFLPVDKGQNGYPKREEMKQEDFEKMFESLLRSDYELQLQPS